MSRVRPAGDVASPKPSPSGWPRLVGSCRPSTAIVPAPSVTANGSIGTPAASLQRRRPGMRPPSAGTRCRPQSGADGGKGYKPNRTPPAHPRGSEQGICPLRIELRFNPRDQWDRSHLKQGRWPLPQSTRLQSSPISRLAKRRRRYSRRSRDSARLLLARGFRSSLSFPPSSATLHRSETARRGPLPSRRITPPVAWGAVMTVTMRALCFPGPAHEREAGCPPRAVSSQRRAISIRLCRPKSRCRC